MSSFKPAVRAGVGLLVGIAGPTGSGKTFSALRLARGLAGGDDQAIAFVDTEAGRALHYAAGAGETPTASTFAFSHADLAAPFTPERYLALIEEADRASFKVIVIDSFSHEWDGEGGLMELHDEIHEQMGGQDKQSIAAWKAPKLRHKRLVSRLLQCRAHLVICMRAEDKLKMETVEQTDERTGRTWKKAVVTQAKDLPAAERWAPICEKRFPYELITSLVLTPDRPGVPVPLKLQEQHRPFVPLDRPIDESAGAALAAWAKGAAPAGARPATGTPKPTASAASQPSTGDLQRGPPGASGVKPGADFPGDLVRYAGVSYDPAQPCPLRAPLSLREMETHEARAWATALADLMKRAPAHARRAWFDRNTPEILELKARGPALAARLEELARSSAALAEGGAPEADGYRAAGAPPHLQGAA